MGQYYQQWMTSMPTQNVRRKQTPAYFIFAIACAFGTRVCVAQEAAEAAEAVIVETAKETKAVADTKKADAGDKKAEGEAKETKAGEKAEAGEKKADETKKDEKKAPQNPLNNWIRNIFGGQKKPARIIPKQSDKKAEEEKTANANGDRLAKDRIEARAPYDPEMAKLLRQATTYMKEAREEGKEESWSLALKVLQYVLDPRRPGKEDELVENSLVRGKDGEFTTMRQEANRLLAEFPEDQLTAYRQKSGGLAQQLWIDAQQSGRIDEVVAIATQFFHTPAGVEAASWMGQRHFDNGEFGMAARWFGELLKFEAPITKQKQWQLKAAITFHHAGDVATSRKLIAELGDTELRIHGEVLTAKDYLAKLPKPDLRHIPELDNWPMIHGTASHLATAQGGEPLLLSRWHQPLTHSQKAKEMISELVDDLIDEQRAPVPAFQPIMVDGKVIFRTLGGVRVADAQSGRTLWETRPGLSPETLMTGVRTAQPSEISRMVPFGGNTVQYSSGNGANHSPITNLLFRNGCWGGISSQGDQLFVLEDHAVMLMHRPENHWNFQNGVTDPHRRDYSTNKIVSYNIHTGRPRWEVGGTAMDEPFDRRLAGHYFYGTPIADGDELFAIGEKDNEIRLFALNPETGRELWSQLLAYTDAKIERDFARRFWSAQVGVGQGVIVCPTTVGWLVGVDRLNHSILWIQRYTEIQKQSNRHSHSSQDNNLVQSAVLNDRWAPSAPVIVGNRVVFTPSEDGTVICLDLFTGKELWQRQKDQHLYLAGVFENQTVLVGKTSMEAIDLDSGSTLWTLEYSQDAGKPCGRGVAVGNQYHLSMTGGHLLTVDLARGKVATKAELPDGLPMLGNLGMYRGLLVSLGPKGLTAYVQKQAIEQEILTRRQKNPNDPWAMLFEANIFVLQENFDEAMQRLRKVNQADLSEDNQARYRDLMMTSLVQLVQSDFRKRDAEYAELSEFVKSDSERLKFQRLTADRLRAQGDFQSAFDEYLSLADARGQELIERSDAKRVSLSLNRWLAGRLEILWSEVSGDQRARIDQRIASAAMAAQSGGVGSCQRFLMLFGFHPAAVGVRKHLVEEFALTGEIAQAQNQLLKLTQHRDDRTAANALVRMVQLFRDRGRPKDAGYYASLLQQKYPNVKLDNERLAKDQVAMWNKTGGIESTIHEAYTWSDAAIEDVRSGASYSYYSNQSHDLQYTPYRLPYFQERRLQFYQSHQRLGITVATTDEPEWQVPLRTSPGHSQGNMMPNRLSGHTLFVVHSGVVHALSPLDREVLWTRPLETRSNRYANFSNEMTPQLTMQLGSKLNPQGFLQADSNRHISLAAANSNVVCLLGRRELIVLDTMTGDVMWRKDRLPIQSKVYATNHTVFIVQPDTSQTLAYRAIDGQPRQIPKLETFFAKTMKVLPEGLIFAENKAGNSILGLSRGTTVIRCYSPEDDEDLWKFEYPNADYFSLMDDNYAMVLKATGKFESLDLETGNKQKFDPVAEADLKSKTELRVLSDHDNVYLIINKKRSSNGRYYSYYSSSSMPTIPVNGLVLAWNRNTGKFLWKQSVTDQKLTLMHFTQCPLLLFNTQMYKRVNNHSFYAMRNQVLDKFTGKVQVDFSAPSNYSTYQSYQLRLGERMLELRSYQNRLRLRAMPPGTAKPPEKPAPAVAE